MNGMLRHAMTSSKNGKNAKLDYAISSNLLVVLNLKTGQVLLFACQSPNDLDKTFFILFIVGRSKETQVTLNMCLSSSLGVYLAHLNAL